MHSILRRSQIFTSYLLRVSSNILQGLLEQIHSHPPCSLNDAKGDRMNDSERPQPPQIEDQHLEDGFENTNVPCTLSTTSLLTSDLLPTLNAEMPLGSAGLTPATSSVLEAQHSSNKQPAEYPPELRNFYFKLRWHDKKMQEFKRLKQHPESKAAETRTRSAQCRSSNQLKQALLSNPPYVASHSDFRPYAENQIAKSSQMTFPKTYSSQEKGQTLGCNGSQQQAKRTARDLMKVRKTNLKASSANSPILSTSVIPPKAALAGSSTVSEQLLFHYARLVKELHEFQKAAMTRRRKYHQAKVAFEKASVTRQCIERQGIYTIRFCT